MTDVVASMGHVGLPAPVDELAARDWDVVVVGGGHNGLTAAAYLAKAGKSVLVLEARERLGGACTLEQPFADDRYVVSPCAYVVGLLDQLVVDELALSERYGYRVTPADPNLWCPFPDGSSFASFLDDRDTAAHMRENDFSESDIEGLFAYENLFKRARLALRHGSLGDTWLGSSPDRSALERALGDDELIDLVFEDSIADVLVRYVDDSRLQHALFGQGVIGTFAGPRDPGTASIKLMHHQGDLLGLGSVWGYVEGGMGRISFAIAQAALDAGAMVATGVPVARVSGDGGSVELESGETISAGAVVVNADPKRLRTMLGDAVPSQFAERLDDWQVRSPVAKLNIALSRLPAFTAAGKLDPERAMVSITPGLDAAQDAFEACKRGEPALGFAELYFQTGYDAGVAPAGKHTMSVFAQYAPYELAEGDWDSRRSEIETSILDAIAVYAPDVHNCVEFSELLGPPDIEQRVGLTGGHIFQGDARPGQMWQERFDHRTGIDGLYMCGAATHPAGSVIALNGRNAAMALLEDVAD